MDGIWIAGGLLGVVGIAAAVILYLQNRRAYREIDQMLDEVLNREEITQSDIREGRLSALAGKAKRVQEMLELEISHAEKEKEQVKSLISNMSHQLKTPLANLMMYEEILDTGDVSAEEQKRFLKKMRGQSEKIDWILRSLFKMMKLEQNVISFEAEECSVRETLLDALNTVYEKAEKKGIEIRMEPFVDQKLWHNRRWTAEVFANILENAVKYTEHGGEIVIGCKEFEMYTQVWVRDNGRGIRKEELTEIFKRFYRGKDVEHIEGSGIGLYLSKMILEKEKGYLNVESEYGKGSCFSVFLLKCVLKGD